MLSDRLAIPLSERRHEGQKNARRGGFSLMELLIVIAIILVILTVALPKLNNAVRGAREVGAAKAITTIQTAQVQYYSNYNRFAASLTELGPPSSGPEGPGAANLIERDLASGEKGGYKYECGAMRWLRVHKSGRAAREPHVPNSKDMGHPDFRGGAGRGPWVDTAGFGGGHWAAPEAASTGERLRTSCC